MKDRLRATGEISYWWFFGIGLLVVTTIILLAIQPTLNNLWIKQFRTTNEYQTTKENLMFKLVQEYEKLEVKASTSDNPALYSGQMKALLDRIQNEARLLSDAGGTVPSSILEFLRKHKRNY